MSEKETPEPYGFAAVRLTPPPTDSRTSTDSTRYSYNRDYELGEIGELDSLSGSSLGDGDTESGIWSDDTLTGAQDYWSFRAFRKASKHAQYWRGSKTQLAMYAAEEGAKLALQALIQAFYALRHNPRAVFVIIVTVVAILVLQVVVPVPTTVHFYLGSLVGLVTLTVLKWAQFLRGYLQSQTRFTTFQLSSLCCCTTLVLYGLFLGFTPVEEVPVVPIGSEHRYFIAANLYNNENILDHWTTELRKVIDHLGPSNTYVSIYESNSDDATPAMLAKFGQELDTIGVRHRIVSDKGHARWWPYDTSPERIEFLAEVRNKVLEPIQSEDEAIRIPDYDQYEKVIFLNDILYTWQSVIRLLATSTKDENGIRADGDYDLACGMDMQMLGLYDTWVARDVCGTPMRVVWPYVKDKVAIKKIRKMEPFPVSACWNGMVAFPPAPVLYKPPTEALASQQPASNNLHKRGWKMIDNATDPHTLVSPPVTTPLKFRPSGIQACDHSECFLFSYDLHRLYPSRDRPARILMNPNVEVAYKWRWYYWYIKVLRAPVVKIWRDHVSHGWPQKLTDASWERTAKRSRDYCTWAGLAATAPGRCPPLPGAGQRGWSE